MPKVYNKHHGNAPADAVYIGRGSPFGNPWRIAPGFPREKVIELFESALSEGDKEFIRQQLRGKDLVCFCAPQACHGDILLRIANEVENADTPADRSSA